MSLFVTSPPNVRGVFAEEVVPPSIVQATGTNVAVIVGQFPWGPAESLNYPSSIGDFYNTYAPRGMDRTGSGHLSVIRKGWPQLGAVRVKDPAAVAATAPLKTSGNVTVLTLTMKYPGTAGNSIIVTTGAADDGNSNHVNITVSVTGASGTTTEIYRNINVSGVGANVLPVVTNSLLVGSVAVGTQGIIAAGNVTASGGTDGTTTSNHYVGTPGGNDFGFALLEGDQTISHVFTDDPGNSLRAAVNAGLLAHVDLTTDRNGYINGPQGQSASAAQSDVQNYRSIRIVYVDPWASIYDDTDGTLRLAPGAPWAASVAAQIPPSASISWRSQAIKAMLDGIIQLEFNRGSNRGQNTAAGIATLIPRKKSGFTFEAGVNSSAVTGQTEITRTRMGQYIARSVVDAWEPYIDAPNIAIYQQDMINGAQAFLDTLKNNKNANPAVVPYVNDFRVLDPKVANTTASLALGDFTVPIDVQIGSNMHRIFLALRYGENVTVAAA